MGEESEAVGLMKYVQRRGATSNGKWIVYEIEYCDASREGGFWGAERVVGDVGLYGG